MEFSLVGPDKLKVTLLPDDLERLGIDYRDLDYKDENTRKVLIDLLTEGKLTAGFQPQKAKLYIEVYPRAEGGCVIYYTRLSGGEVLPQGKFIPGPPPIVFAFENPETLLAGASKTWTLYRQRILASALYSMGCGYRLIVHPLDIGDQLSTSFLSEYGKLVGVGAVLAAYIEEHGELLKQPDALEALAGVESVDS
ncbi:MAG: adaptor protein MecA [Oscillospiraceae bacterium]|nr:adaptor protein MecA [Oscillospiraceae bacterium]